MADYSLGQGRDVDAGGCVGNLNGALGIGSAVDLFGSLATIDAESGRAEASELPGRDATTTSAVESPWPLRELRWWERGNLEAMRTLPAVWADALGAPSVSDRPLIGDTIWHCEHCHVICAI